MKIGVIGPEVTVNVVRKVAEKDLPDIQFVYRCSEFFEQSADSAALLQEDTDVDAILFTGPTNYAYARKRLVPTVPWSHLPHNRTSALQAFLEATSIYGSDLKSISVDRYDSQLMRNVLESGGIHDTTIIRAPFDFEEPGFEKKLQDFHRDCYLQGKVSVCFTSMEHIYEPLRAEGIPCIRIYPSEEVVHEQVYHLQILDISAKENQGKHAIIGIKFDYIFDDIQDLAIREWEKVQYQNEFKERVYAAAQRMEAAVFNEGFDHYFITTSRSMLMNSFLKNGEHSRFLQLTRRSPAYKVWMGIGIGTTMLEAKSRAAMALNHSRADQTGGFYLVENESQTIEALPVEEVVPLDQTFAFFAKKVQISTDTLEKIQRVLQQYGDTITSEELAEHLGITSRSVNRIISRLEEQGCVTIVGKRSTGKGRPARVMKITLPEALTPEV
ncbi:MAG: HTH domain-containing protein [Oscillibacter sp.]|nr:HTH domain-containing protein [Oscillibacter sp.]